MDNYHYKILGECKCGCGRLLVFRTKNGKRLTPGDQTRRKFVSPLHGREYEAGITPNKPPTR